MRVLTFIILSFISLVSFGQRKQVCFSIDDLPVVSYGITDTLFQKALMDKLVSSLNKHKIPAIGFVNEIKLYDRENRIRFQVDLLNSWVDHGLELGNHTFSHIDYNNISFKKYAQEIVKGEIVTREVLGRKGKTIKYFRHPYLHAGDTKEKADSLNDFLLHYGYIPAPVTIDNEDYLFALAYSRATVKKDNGLMVQIGKDYIEYMEKKVKYYERLSRDLFGREIPQILLLHSSALNSDYADSLALMFKKINYDFISMEKALEDPAYKTAVAVYGKWGISWIDRWALSKGKKGDFFKDEPETPDYIKKLSE